MTQSQAHFFLGAAAPGGFHSFFRELYDPLDGWYACLLKGGPGTGKSSLLRAVADGLDARGISTQRIACAADPQSLDAVIVPQKRVVLADATAPHILEPQYPGAADEIVHLGAFWDAAALREKRGEILALSAEIRCSRRRCERFLSAAAALGADIRRLAQPFLDAGKIDRYAQRLATRDFPAPCGEIGREAQRFLSAPTPQGITTLWAGMAQNCDKIYVLDDPHGAVSRRLLEALRRYALGNGLDVICCPCPLAPQDGTEHLLIPALRLGFFTANRFHPASFPQTQTVTLRAARFQDNDALRSIRERMHFTRRAQKELLREASAALENAKEIHGALESIYIAAMDFSQHEMLAEKLLRETLTRPDF